MRKVFRRANTIIAAVLVNALVLASSSEEAGAQSTFINQNISGFNLPGVQLPQGSDEVRAADGTTCRSAVGGDGAYIDIGVIGNPQQSTTDSSVAAYTRLVVPLGKKRERIDCRRLYDLEVRRLEIELRLVELGLNRGIAPVSETETRAFSANEDVTTVSTDPAGNKNETKTIEVAENTKTSSWADDGWTTDGLSDNN